MAQINPIWQFGQYQPDKISYAVQPDWYMGWLDGALRIMPSWEFTGFGHTIPFVVLLPAVDLPRAHLHPLLRLAGHRTALHRATTTSTTCSTGPGTGRNAPPPVRP